MAVFVQRPEGPCRGFDMICTWLTLMPAHCMRRLVKRRCVLPRSTACRPTAPSLTLHGTGSWDDQPLRRASAQEAGCGCGLRPGGALMCSCRDSYSCIMQAHKACNQFLCVATERQGYTAT